MNNLPAIIRALGVCHIKMALAAPMPAAAGIKPPPNPARAGINSLKPPSVKSPIAPIANRASQNLSSSAMDTASLFAPKTAGLDDTALRLGTLFGEDAFNLALRTGLRGGASVAAVPVAYERAQQVNDPNFAPNENMRYLRKMLSAASKMAGVDTGLENSESVGSVYDNRKLMLERDPQARIQDAIDSNSGPAFKASLPDEATGGHIGIGNSPKVASGNSQEDDGLDNRVDNTENRGPTGDMPNTMHGQGMDTLAGNALGVKSLVNKAFDGMRAFNAHDAINLYQLGNEESVSGPEV